MAAGIEMPVIGWKGVGELQKSATDRTKVAGRLFLSFTSLQSLERKKKNETALDPKTDFLHHCGTAPGSHTQKAGQNIA
jgi:hypothetical protein